MKLLFYLLLPLFLLVIPGRPSPKLCGTNAVAHTLLEVKSITATEDFVFTGFSLTVHKMADDSQLSYDAQITYQFTTPEPYGILFQMRVEDEKGESIKAETGSRGVGMGAYVGNTLPMMDTTYDYRTGKQPLAGTYTFKVFAKVGGSVAQLMPFESTIRVTEIPAATICSE